MKNSSKHCPNGSSFQAGPVFQRKLILLSTRQQKTIWNLTELPQQIIYCKYPPKKEHSEKLAGNAVFFKCIILGIYIKSLTFTAPGKADVRRMNYANAGLMGFPSLAL